VDFPPLDRIAFPIIEVSVCRPGVKIHETHVIRLIEALLHPLALDSE